MKRVHYQRNPRVDNDPIINFRDSLKNVSEKMGEKPVFIYTEHKKEYSISYRQFYENVKNMGTAFEKMGLQGEAVAVIGDAHPAYTATYYATICTNGTVVPLDKDITLEEIAGFLKSANVKAVVYTESQNNRIGTLVSELPEMKYFIPVSPETEEATSERTLSFDQVLKLGKEEYDKGNHHFDEREIDLQKCCSIIFTSGTTGTSKGVMLNQGNLVAATTASVTVMDQLNENTVLLSVLPMHHTYEFTCVHMAGVYLGATIALNNSLKYVAKNIKKYKPTFLVLVPLFIETMHKKIFDEIRKKGIEKKVHFAMKLATGLKAIGIDVRRKLFKEILDNFGGNLQGIVSGGAKLNPQLIHDFRAFGIEIQEGYGITECAPLLAANPLNANKIGSVGPAVKGVSVKIDKVKPEDETGEILAKGPNVMMGYYNNKDATDAVFTEDHYFRTGDIGYLDEDGYIYITGRKKNVIILSNGKNIFPEELEEHLANCPLFLESAVVGREKGGSEPVITAVIYPDYEALKGLSDEEIEEKVRTELNNINRTLPQYKQMRGLEIRKTEFEKTTSRKIKRYKI